ncbi:hypothetical protein ACFMI9_19430, partial [Acinetobacter baumannii]|uniref:hypothetical protein n=1 Tax=Acinetobacter baumannii TaxID=470 RepID=UPI003670F01E
IIVSQSWIQHVLSMLSDGSRKPMVTGHRYGIKDGANWLERTWFGAMQRKPASYINSGNLICDAEVFHSIGGFSESLVTGEDVDFG